MALKAIRMTTMKLKLVFRWLAILLAPYWSITAVLAQNCLTTVTAGADTILCAPGTVPLRAQIAGSSTSVLWSPATGVANTTAANTTAMVSATTTYTVSVRSLSPTNLITNGDFSLGNTGFTSDYSLGTSGSLGPLTQEGRYVVVNDAGTTHTQFADCNDHTTGNGLMMVVNASGTTNDVWCQTITINPNTEYDFSAWVTSVTSQNPARLQFSINGVLLGSQFNALSATCQWRQFAAQWTSGNTVTAEICIVNVNLTPAGNDFALDDISFREICVATDSTVVQVAQLSAGFTPPTGLCQSSGTVDPNTWLSATTTTGGQWTVDGQPFTSFNPASLSAGPHQIRYRVVLGPCSAENIRTITIAVPPNAGSPAPAQQLCRGDNSIINLFNLLTGADAGGQWQDVSPIPAGSAFNAASSNLTTAGLPTGSYLFRYTLTGQSGCPNAQNEVAVTVNEVPSAQAGPDATIDCDQPSQLLGSAPATDPNLSYSWTLGAQALHTGSVPQWTAIAGGTYTLLVENSQTGCSAEDEVVVTSLISDVTAALATEPADCANPNSGSISVNGPAGGTPPYMYAINGGAFLGDPTFENLAPGDYTVVVQDAVGCQTTLMANLPSPANFTVDLVAAGDDVLLEFGESVRLSAITTLDPALIDTIYWLPVPPDCEGCTTAVVTPTSSMSYQVEVVDRNGCSATDSIAIRVILNRRVYLPNVFSPNDDGVNDRFFVQSGASLSQVKLLRIADRWGGMVYERTDLLPNDYTSGWDGKTRSQAAPPGVYVYYIELSWADGSTSTAVGEVSLVR